MPDLDLAEPPDDGPAGLPAPLTAGEPTDAGADGSELAPHEAWLTVGRLRAAAALVLGAAGAIAMTAALDNLEAAPEPPPATTPITTPMTTPVTTPVTTATTTAIATASTEPSPDSSAGGGGAAPSSSTTASVDPSSTTTAG